MSIFGPPPECVELVERATSQDLIDPDWSLNALVWDYIQTIEDGPGDACKAIRKRIKHSNPKVALLALVLLESAVKNCPPKFHEKALSKDTMSVLKKVIENRKISHDVQNKALELVMSWREAFEDHAQHGARVVALYDALREKGYKFPARNMDAMAPIFTPPRTHEPTPRPAPPAVQPGAHPHPHAHPHAHPHGAAPMMLPAGYVPAYPHPQPGYGPQYAAAVPYGMAVPGHYPYGHPPAGGMAPASAGMGGHPGMGNHAGMGQAGMGMAGAPAAGGGPPGQSGPCTCRRSYR
eukprot:gnl/Trimastix_PCT/2119.p1 GENE.gnl/Trimastix_PCT/2119~~gnl/Trimastix_PCT/2119.p1  ORF type:complete len:293 (-),score=18.51 gnl/Trimastix_PCT/2119:32-910(-)